MTDNPMLCGVDLKLTPEEKMMLTRMIEPALKV